MSQRCATRGVAHQIGAKARFSSLSRNLARDLGHEAAKTLDPAASPDARMDAVAPGAHLALFGGQVEAVVEVERRTILRQLGAKPRPVEQQEIHRFAARKGGAADARRRRCTSGPLLLLPFERRSGSGRTGTRMITSCSTTSVRTSSDCAAETRSRTSPETAREEAQTALYAIVSPDPRPCGHRVEQSMNCRGKRTGRPTADSTCANAGALHTALPTNFIGLVDNARARPDRHPGETRKHGDRRAHPGIAAFLQSLEAAERRPAWQNEDPPDRKRSGDGRRRHAVPVTVDEFALLQRHYPIVFSVGGDPVPLALMGLNEGTNVFLDDDGLPHDPSIYIPAYMRRYPFLLARLRPDSDELSLCFDPTSGAVGEFEDGEAAVRRRPSRRTRPRRSCSSASSSKRPASAPRPSSRN